MDQTTRVGRLERWLKTFSSRGSLDTSVSDPKPSRKGNAVTSAVFGPTTLFTVTTVSPEDARKDMWNVERSMSDFVALRSTLVQRFPGAVLAHLPESRVTDLTKSKEEKSTKQGEILNHFLRFLCRHPFISQDQVFLTFLSVSSKFSDALKAVAPAAPINRFGLTKMLSSSAKSKRKSIQDGLSQPIQEDPTSAMEWWREAIDLAAEPSDPQRLSKDVLAELDRLKKRITDLKVTIRDFKEKLKAVGGSCLDLHKAFQAWLAVEYSPDAVSVTALEEGNHISNNNGAGDLTITNGSADGSSHEMVVVNMSMPTLLTENSNRFHRQGLIHQRMALDAASTLLSAVREEILVLDAMKEEVTAARDAVIRVEDAKAHLAKKEKELQHAEEQARLTLGSIPTASSDTFAYEDDSTMAQLDPAVEKKTRAIRKAKEDAIVSLETATVVAATLTRSTLNLELNFFREERIIRSDKFFREFARVHSEYCAKSLQVWTMKAIEGVPPPPVDMNLASAALSSTLPKSQIKERVGRLQTATSAMAKSGMYDSTSTYDDNTEQEEDGEMEIVETTEEQLVEWGPEIPWDPAVPRLIEIVYDFDPEHGDEIEGKAGERGTAVPFDGDRQWLHVKLANGGKSGIIPTDFVRIIALVKQQHHQPKKKSQSQASIPSVPEEDQEDAKEAMREEYEAKLKELEEQLNAARHENDTLRHEVNEREEYITTRANELADTNQALMQIRSEYKNVQLERDYAVSERDRALSECAHAIQERDQLREALTQKTKIASPVQAAAASSMRAASGMAEVFRADPVTKQSAVTTSSPSSDPNESLPPNWVKGFDKTRNRYFYHNTVTKESVWKLPNSSSGTKRKQGQ